MQLTVSLNVDVPATTSIADLELVIQEAGQQAMRMALCQAVRAYEAQHQTCPHCGNTLVQGEGTDRRVLRTIFGRVVLAPRRLRCQGCGRRFRPADGCLASLDGKQVTPALARAAVQAGAAWPYATAARELAWLCGAAISPEQVRQLTNQQGMQEASQQAQKASDLVEPTAALVRAERDQEQLRSIPSTPPALLVIGWDGGWVPSREQKGGMEGKVGVVVSGTERVGKQRQRMTPRRYVATFAASEQVGKLTYAAVCELGAEEAQAQVVLGDGANWIKSEAALHFPEAVTILDWPQLWRVVQAAVRAARPGPRWRAVRRECYQALHQALWFGQVDMARVQLQALRPSPAEAPVEALEAALIYLENQRAWIGNYQHWREMGYPVGSGLVERAVALIINRRLKRQGMRWRHANATAVVALRVRTINADWEAASAQRHQAA